MATAPAKSDAATGAKAALDKLADLIKALAGRSDDADKVGDNPADTSRKKTDPIEEAAETLLAQARAVRDRYDSSVKWIVGAFVALGALVFGSLPFTNAVGAPLVKEFLPTGILWGLLAVAIGIGLVVWARTRGLEPQDATLGELAATLDRVRKRLAKDSRFRRLFRNPIDVSSMDMLQILQSGEAAAHLGPEIVPESKAGENQIDCGVRQLMLKIKKLDQKAFVGEGVISAADAARADLDKRLEDLMKRIGELTETSAGGTSAEREGAGTAASERRVQLQRQYRDRLEAAISAVGDGVKVRRDHARVLAERRVYFEHRDLLLVESAVSLCQPAG